MPEKQYRSLQERLDLFSMGFPATESGVEIKILKYLFSDQEAEIFLALSHSPETPESIADRSSFDAPFLAEQLESMALRGLVFRYKKNGTSKYAAIPFVHGLFEFQVKRMTTELAGMVGLYFEEAFDTNMQENADGFLRVIPIQQSVESEQHVAAYEDAIEILRTKDQIVVTECICRKSTDVFGTGCGKQLEACFMFGSMGQYYLDNEMGRKIDFEEAKSIIVKCHEAGLVTQPATAQNPAGMCNCCGDCCGVLSAVKKHPSPSDIVFSNYMISDDTEGCTGCEICIDRCQMDALSMGEDDLVSIDKKRCIGCGLCVTTCPAEALKLMKKEKDSVRIPPEGMVEQMIEMAKNRGII